MKSIYITGASGFVGQNVINVFNNKYYFTKYKRGDEIIINHDYVFHFAGKAHDLKNTVNADEYFETNTNLTIKLFDKFLVSPASTFVFISSIKVIADDYTDTITENSPTQPNTVYGESKLKAEQYILNKELPKNKRLIVFRPAMIHGQFNKGNLNLLFKIVDKKIPWPLGCYQNNRAFCSIDNFCFILNEILENEEISSGVYNIADTEFISTNTLIKLIGKSIDKNITIINIPKWVIQFIAKIGDFISLPLNSERLSKLTSSLLVSNNKILKAINKNLPLTAEQGLMHTFKSFKKQN